LKEYSIATDITIMSLIWQSSPTN